MKIERIGHDGGGAARNVERLAELFPNVVTEVCRDGHTVRAVDFDALRRELGQAAVEGEMRYSFTWPDKDKAVIAANEPADAALRPQVERSSGRSGTPGAFDSANVYIEGDNLTALKLLQETYLGRVKMIYIDPPYNTGNDFVYRDRFAQREEEYLHETGAVGEGGERLVTNPETNGRFHTDWLNMIYPRLRVARNLLSDDGFICISIGEEELNNLMTVCNEIFGESNFRNIIAVRRYDKNLNTQFAKEGLTSMNVGLEYVLVYSKSAWSKMCPVYRQASDERTVNGYWKGFWNDADRPTMRYPIFDYTPSDGQWKWKKEVAYEAVENYETYVAKFSSAMSLEEYWRTTGKSKRFIRKNPKGKGKNMGVEHWVAPSEGILRSSNWADILASKPTGFDLPFDSPKNVDLIKKLAELSFTSGDALILDFFSGSATTAHAVMELNAEDGGNRRFIMVQIPEVCAEGSEARSAGYANICEIGEERIRRAGRKIIEEHEGARGSLDVGFRVFKIDSPNMKDSRLAPGDTMQGELFESIENIKDDRTPQDLLVQAMLALGITLDAQVESECSDRTEDKLIFVVRSQESGADDGPDLVACFDEDVSEDVAAYIADKKPQNAVFCDACFPDDSARENYELVFEYHSRETKVRVI